MLFLQLIAFLTFGTSVWFLGSERNFKGVGLGILSIGMERYTKISEYITPAAPPDRIRIYNPMVCPGPTRITTIYTEYPKPNRVYNNEMPVDHSKHKNCTFSRSCPGRRPKEPDITDLILYHPPHASSHIDLDLELLFWFAMLIISVCIMGSGLFWDKNHSIFSHIRKLALARSLYGDERLDEEENGIPDEEPGPCKRCAGHWVSDSPPLIWIDKYTWLQGEYSSMKAKKRYLRARLRRKNERVRELAQKNILLRSAVWSHKDSIFGLCRKIKEIDNCVDEMRQVYKIVKIGNHTDPYDIDRQWEEREEKYKNMGHLPTMRKLFKRELLDSEGRPWRSLARRAPVPWTPPSFPNANGMFG